MQHLDLLTVRVMTMVTVLISGLATLGAWKINRSVPGMRLFALGLVSMGLGSVVGLSGTVLSGDAIPITGTALRFGGMIAIVQAFRIFRGFPPLRLAWVAGLSAFVGVLYIYWLIGVDREWLRTGLVSGALSILAVDAARSMMRRVPARDRSTYWPTGLIFGFVAIPLALRAVGELLNFSRPLSPESIETAWTLCANIAFVGSAFGMLLAANTRLRREAESTALFDPLTNLPNRRLFQERLLEAEQRAIETGSWFGVVYLDLDGFKLVNDTLGHDAGDDMLRGIGIAMAAMLGPGDCLARVGGDEFVVLVEDIEGSGELSELAAKLKAAVALQTVTGLGGVTLRASCGIAIFPKDGSSARDVMREADLEMFHSKRRSRAVGQSAAG